MGPHGMPCRLTRSLTLTAQSHESAHVPCMCMSLSHMQVRKLGAACCVSCVQGWGWCFILPGFIMMGLSLLIFAFLVVQPSDAGVTNPEGGTKDEEVGVGTVGGEQVWGAGCQGLSWVAGLWLLERVRTGGP